MRLAIVSPFPPEISGIGQYGLRVATTLASSGRFDAVRVFASRDGSSPPEENSHSFTIRRCWSRNRLGVGLNIAGAVKAWRPDVVWYNIGLSVFGASRLANFSGLASPMLTRLAGIPSVATLHEIFEATDLRALGAVSGRITKLGGRAAMRVLLRANTVCFTLNAYTRIIHQHYGATNVAHVPHGAFDKPHFEPLPGDKRILVFATFAPYKGLPQLLEIFSRLHREDPQVCLTVAGSDHPRFPGYLSSVRAQFHSSTGIDWKIAPAESDLPALFASARVVALPYTATTGASSVAHRAAAHGRPVVAYDLPDLRAVMKEERLRLELVPLGDSRKFGGRLKQLLDDAVLCETIGKANSAAMHSMTIEATCRRYIQLFEAAVQCAPLGSAVQQDNLT